MEPNSNVIDPHPLIEIRSLEQNGIPGLLSKAIGKYLEHSSTLMDDLGKAVQQHDADAQFRIAHSLKSSSASMGAVTLAEVCAALENMGRQGKTEDADQIFEEMLPLYISVCETLKTDWLDVAA